MQAAFTPLCSAKQFRQVACQLRARLCQGAVWVGNEPCHWRALSRRSVKTGVSSTRSEPASQAGCRTRMRSLCAVSARQGTSLGCSTSGVVVECARFRWMRKWTLGHRAQGWGGATAYRCLQPQAATTGSSQTNTVLAHAVAAQVMRSEHRRHIRLTQQCSAWHHSCMWSW
jgi:hypothetical protein